MNKRILTMIISISLLLMTACEKPKVGYEKSWEEMEDSGKNSIVMVCYDGDDGLASWLEKDVATYLKKTYQIELRLTRLATGDMIDYLKESREDKNHDGEYDILIFDNSKFKELKSENLLYKDLSKYIKNYRKYFTGKHLNEIDINGTAIDELAVPISQKQLCFYYNDDMLAEVPENIGDFKEVIMDNKGAFTYPSPNTELGRAFVSSVILEFVPDNKINKDNLSKNDIKKLITPAMIYLKELSPHLFGSGKYHPINTRELDLLFKEGHIMMNINMSHLAAKKKLENDEYPEYPRPVNPLGSSVTDVTYAAVPFNSVNKSGAIITINAIIGLDIQKALYSNNDYERTPSIDVETLNEKELNALDASKASKTVIKPSKLLRSKRHKIRDDYWLVILEEWNKIFNVK